MKVISCEISGLVIIEPKIFGDDRGFFFELWQNDKYSQVGVKGGFVQDNISRSRRGTLRGLHFQNPNAQGKLVSVLDGEVFDVAVDLRQNSATFGRWHGLMLSGESKKQFFIPPGFAHGFAVMSESALFHYKCTELYSAKDELTLKWDDPDLAIQWPLNNPMLSERDQNGLRLKDLPAERLFH